ncbi:MAG: hypothetical protein OEY14_05155 [Myxococcales bacterium]|nr:hypothetical protein [Myxococcales bacterium]
MSNPTVSLVRRRSRPLRREDAESLWFVTTRIEDEVFWLHPLLSSRLRPANRRACRAIARKRKGLDGQLARLVRRRNQRCAGLMPPITIAQAKVRAENLVVGALARAQAFCARDGAPPVQIFAVVVMSNHLHLVLRAPAKNLSSFMGYFKKRIAHDINMLRGRRGHVFSRRFDAQPIFGHEAARQRVAYTLRNPVKSKLVRCPTQWPGFVAVAGMHDESELRCRYFDATAWQQAKQPEDREPFWRELTLTLSPLPGHEDQTPDDYLREALAWRYGQADQDPPRVLGIDKVLDTSFDARPPRSKRSCRPYAFGSRQDLELHRERMGRCALLYDECRERQRRGERDIRWPEGMYPPGASTAA